MTCSADPEAAALKHCRVQLATHQCVWQAVACLLLSGVVAAGCIADMVTAAINREAAEAVGRELASPQRSELRTCFNTFGEGVLAFLPEKKTEDKIPVWVYVRGRAYALEAESAALTPKLQRLSDAPDEVRRLTRLEETSIAEIRRYVTSQ
jgi:hypothetical protein